MSLSKGVCTYIRVYILPMLREDLRAVLQIEGFDVFSFKERPGSSRLVPLTLQSQGHQCSFQQSHRSNPQALRPHHRAPEKGDNVWKSSI